MELQCNDHSIRVNISHTGCFVKVILGREFKNYVFCCLEKNKSTSARQKVQEKIQQTQEKIVRDNKKKHREAPEKYTD